MDDRLNDIIKYRKGELSPKEMHALERQTLNDPFLSEALEGTENISAEDLMSDVSQINRKILKKKKATLFTPLRIAAGIALVIGSVILFYQLTPKKESLALKTENNNSLTPTSKPIDSLELQNQSQPKQTGVADESKKEINKPSPEKSKKSDEGYIAVTPKVKNEIQQIDAKTNTESKVENKELKENLQEVASAPVNPLEIQTQDLKAEKMPTAKMNRAVSKSEQLSGAGLAKRQSFTIKSISGKVVSADDGTALPGVNVVVDGTSQGTVTDANGSFNIQVSDDQQKLVFSFVGMQTKEVELKGKDKLDIEMNADASQLSEVVVVGYGISNQDRSEPIILLAYPEGGAKAYDKYLETSVHYPEEALKNNVKGKVKVEFVLHADGSFDQFKVLRRIGFGCEEELIRLIKEGPRWFPTTENGNPVESHVRVGLKFDPTKNGR
jgi:TonB family protein